MEEDHYKRTDQVTPTSAESDQDDRVSDDIQVKSVDPDLNSPNQDYREETAAEFTAPRFNRVNDPVDETENGTRPTFWGGTIIGGIALILSILSLFTMPVLFGILGIIGGFISRSRGAKSIGSWAIGLGIVSIIVGIFILPFF